MHLAWAVDADGERLLDVGAPARAGHDRERARQVVAHRGEQVGELRDDAVLAQQRDVDVGKQRPGTGLLPRGDENDAPGCRDPVGGFGRLRALEDGAAPR